MWIDPISLLFFLLIAYMLLAPQLSFRSIVNARRTILGALARKRGSNVITLVHRQESIGLLGIPLYRYIDVDDSEEVLRAIRRTPPNKPIDLIIHTPGGLALAAAQIAMALKDHPAKTAVIIPHYAMSGGTLIALAADEIVMDRHAVLGPVDPQLGQYPAPSIVRAVEEKGKDKVKDETLIMADIAQKAIKQARDLITYLLEDKMGKEKAAEVARSLTEGRWTHDYPITMEMAKSLGLNVSTDVPKEVYEVMDLYPQPLSQRAQSVEFVPSPVPQSRGKT